MTPAMRTDWNTIKERTNQTKKNRARTRDFAFVGMLFLCVCVPFSREARAFDGVAIMGGQPERDGGGSDSKRKEGWSIVVGAVAADEPGGEGERAAAEALERVRTKGKLADAKMERRGKSLVIFYGDYDGPESSKATADLERIRAIEVEGALPFARAYLAPPPDEALRGSIAEYDLRNVRQSAAVRALGAGGAGGAGKAKTLYTLQVGVYGNADGSAPKPDDLKEARAAAEKAAVQLRREGEMAFYYHAATLSSVTVGLFRAEELESKDPRAIPGQTVDTPELAMLRKLHPYNLLNGQGIVVRGAGPGAAGKARGEEKTKNLQQSFLVEVPR